jgi:asparagine synthase (glutamine-hydrolysing)
MCGIIGFIDKKDKLTSEERSAIANKMLASIEYRGRDSSNLYSDGKIIMGHNRLTIIDVSDKASQPFISHDRSLVITYNGEIFNHLELRDLTKNKNYISGSDTETFLNLYSEYKEKGFQMIRGMFSVVFHDVPNKQVILANDLYGIKPLYYLDSPDYFAWSSEIKTFEFLPGFNFTLNQSRLFEYGLFRTTVGPDTLFSNVKRLMPGEIIYFDIRSMSFVSKKYNYLNQQVTNNIEECLRLSVNEHLLSDVPVGLQLSGGVDSSLISLLATQSTRQNKIHSFSIGLDDSNWNEFEYSRFVSNQIKSIHHEITFSQKDFCEIFPIATYHLDEPINYPNTIPMMILAREAKKYVTVFLSGEGADEVFGGYNRYKKLYKEELNIADLVLSNSFVSESDLRNVFIFSSEANIENRHEIASQVSNYDTCRKLSEYDIKTFLPSLLLRQDKVGMACNLENRFPFLDPRLVMLGLNLLSQDKFDSNNTKILLKKIALKYFPEKFVNRRKCGFGLPINEWLKDSKGLGKYLTMFTEPKNKRIYLNYNNIRILINQHLSGERDNSELLWILVSLEMWMRIFIDRENVSDIWKKL